MEENFTADDMFYMVRCPKCGKENHGFFVAEGRCAWCGNDEATAKQKARREHNKYNRMDGSWICPYCGKKVYSMEVHPCTQPTA